MRSFISALIMGSLLLILCLVIFAGCATVPPPSQEVLHSEYTDSHTLTKTKAFEITDMWLAKNIKNYQKVIQLRDKESGVFILKPIYEYSVLGILFTGSYTLEIIIVDYKIKYSFDVGPVEYHDNERFDHPIYPNGNKIDEIKKTFTDIRDNINTALKKPIDNF